MKTKILQLPHVHNRVYIPTLARWLAVPGHPDKIYPGVLLCEGACDACIDTVKACLKVQFPALYK